MAVTTIPVFLDFNKSNNEKLLYLVGSLLQSWTAKLPYQRRIFWFKDLAKELLYNYEGYTYFIIEAMKDHRDICRIQSSILEYFLYR